MLAAVPIKSIRKAPRAIIEATPEGAFSGRLQFFNHSRMEVRSHAQIEYNKCCPNVLSHEPYDHFCDSSAYLSIGVSS